MLIVDNKPFAQPVKMVSCQWGWMMCPPGDKYVTGSLDRWGVYSETEIMLLKRLLTAGDKLMVIGGNIGALAAPLAAHGASITVYEPQTVLFPLLQANMALAGGQALCINAAIGPQAGTINVPVIKLDADCNMGMIGKQHWGQGMEVPMLEFNTELQRVRPNMLVLDVEGMELEILKAADSALLPDTMWVECDRVEEGSALIAHLRQLGYTPYWMITPLSPNSAPPNIDPWPMQCSFNLLCRRDGWPDGLEDIKQIEAYSTDAIGTCGPNEIIYNIADKD